jgi:hypothetical protein
MAVDYKDFQPILTKYLAHHQAGAVLVVIPVTAEEAQLHLITLIQPMAVAGAAVEEVLVSLLAVAVVLEFMEQELVALVEFLFQQQVAVVLDQQQQLVDRVEVVVMLHTTVYHLIRLMQELMLVHMAVAQVEWVPPILDTPVILLRAVVQCVSFGGVEAILIMLHSKNNYREQKCNIV